MAKKLDFKKVLRRLTTLIIEDLEPSTILDKFAVYEYLTPAAIRDIRELPTTSEKNRAIIGKVQSKGISGYHQFKKFLSETQQEYLVNCLEEMEREVQGNLESESASWTEPGPATATSQVRTINIADENAINQFKGKTEFNAPIHFGAQGTRNQADRYLPQLASQGDGVDGTYNYGAPNAINNFGGDLVFNEPITFGGTGDRGNLGNRQPTTSGGAQNAGSNAQSLNPNQPTMVQGHLISQPTVQPNTLDHFAQMRINDAAPGYPYMQGPPMNYYKHGQPSLPSYGQYQPVSWPSHMGQQGYQQMPGQPGFSIPGHYTTPQYGGQNTQPPFGGRPEHPQTQGQSAVYATGQPPGSVTPEQQFGQQNRQTPDRRPEHQQTQGPSVTYITAVQPSGSVTPERYIGQNVQAPGGGRPAYQQTQGQSMTYTTTGQPSGSVTPEHQHIAQNKQPSNRTPELRHPQGPSAVPTTGQLSDRVTRDLEYQQNTVQQGGHMTTHAPPQKDISLRDKERQSTSPDEIIYRRQAEERSIDIDIVDATPFGDGGRIKTLEPVINNSDVQKGTLDEQMKTPDVQETRPKERMEVKNDGATTKPAHGSDSVETFPVEELPSITDYHPQKKDVDDGRIRELKWETLENILKRAKKIDSGAFGEIYKPKEKIREWDIHVVVKKIPVEKYTAVSIKNEIVAARIRHHAVVPLLAKCLHEENYYFIFPYMEGGDLMTAIEYDMMQIRQEKIEAVKMKAKKRVLILYKIACAILFIHTPVEKFRKKMFHGDLKSKNIVLTAEALDVRILDFGVAREMKSDAPVRARSGEPIGSYTTRVAEKELSLKSDYKHFGYVILEMLTGKKYGDLKGAQTEFLQTDYSDCYEGVWSNVVSVYNKLKELAGKCLDKTQTIDADYIANTLYDILHGDFSDQVQVEKTEKCSMCMLNYAAQDTQFNLELEHCINGTRHPVPSVCVACMKNSYLNPIQCQRCRKTIQTMIGTCWGAIVLYGYDKKAASRSVFREDAKSVIKTLVSKYPLITGLSPDNVIFKRMEEVEEAVQMMQSKIEITKVIIYYSGHCDKTNTTEANNPSEETSQDASTSEGTSKKLEDDTKSQDSKYSSNKERYWFPVGEDKTLTKEKFEEHLNHLEKDIILVTDCCFSGNLKFSVQNLRLQINASSSSQHAFFETESRFTKYFLQSLHGKSSKRCLLANEEGVCEICDDYRPDHDARGFISVHSLFHYIDRHMEKHSNKNPNWSLCTPSLNMNIEEAKHLFIGYYTDSIMKIEFEPENRKNGWYECPEVPSDMNELKLQLLEHVFCFEYKEDRSLWRNRNTNMMKHSDIITVGYVTGPRKEDKIELNTVEELTAALYQKYPLYYGLRDISDLMKGKVGLFPKDNSTNDISTNNMVKNYLKCEHFHGILTMTEDDNGTIVTIQWENVRQRKVLDVLAQIPKEEQEQRPEHCFLRDTWRKIAQLPLKNEEELEALVMTIPVGFWTTASIQRDNFLTLEVKCKEASTKPASQEMEL